MRHVFAYGFLKWCAILSIMISTGCVGVDRYGDLSASRPRFGQNTTSVEGRVSQTDSSIWPASKRTDNIVEIIDQRIDFSALLPRAVVNVRLTSKYRSQVMYRFHWYDEQGIELTSRNQVWRSLMLDGYGESTLTDQAPIQSAAEFRVQLRRP
jgi:uncharacterized protein YcfL